MAQRHQEFLDRGGRVFGISADTAPMNTALVEKLALPFPVLSDPDRSNAVTPLGFADEKDPREIARPGAVDGSYDDKYTGKIVGVDAGIIGLVPEALMDLPAVDGIGFMVEFKYDTEATDDGRGDLTFGEHRFDTAGIDDDEDSYECFECGEQWCEGECAWEEE
jgi:hypothetical protein